MLHLYRNCDAVDCKSTKGRDFSKPGTDLELVSLNNLQHMEQISTEMEQISTEIHR